MFGAITAFELRYQLRQPVFWIAALVFFLVSLTLASTDFISVGSGGNVHKNSPQAIAVGTAVWSVFFMFAATAFAANIIVRDDETGYGPIVRSTRIRKFDYLYGRFLGAFAAVALAFLSVPLGQLLGSLAPWVDPETLGPNRLEYYAFAYFWLALPSLFVASAMFFALATITRSMMATYLGVAGFLVVYFVTEAALGVAELREVAALTDPFGANAYGLATRYYTAAESNTLVPPIEGALLYNRLIWLGVGAAMLALAHWLFRFEVRGRKARRLEKLRAGAEGPEAAAAAARPLPPPTFGPAAAWAQLLKRTRFEIGQVVKSPAYIVLLLVGLLNAVGILALTAERGGTRIYPVTSWVVTQLTGGFTMFVIIIAVFYAGELVWRERDRKTHEIIDATAAPDWSFLVPKTLAIVLVLVSTLVIAAASGVAVQAAKGFTDFQLDKYLLWYIFPNSVFAVLIAVLAVFFQVITPHKFIGWGLMLVWLLVRIGLDRAGLQHNLYNYGGGTFGIRLSDMNGQGDFAAFAAWMQAYWAAFALILLVLGYGLWRRGTETRFAPRLRRLPHKLRGTAGVVGGVALAAFVGLGVFVFVNTNVWNEYRTTLDDERWSADYEKRFLRYEKLPQPSVTDVVLAVDIHPHEPRLETRGSYRLVNDTGAPVRQLHLRLDRDTQAREIRFSAPVREQRFDRFNYRILTLERPMQPGEAATLSFRTLIHQRGFKNRGNITRVVDNGTFVNNFEFAPVIGMDRRGVLQDRAKRRKYGLPAELRPAKLEDRAAQARNYLANADWVNADITVSTVADQTPIAPGYRVSDVTQDGRRTIRYRTDAPVLHFFSVQSARYAIKRQMHRGVELAIYYDPQHPWNVDKMLAALRTGLDYFQANFSPYQFRQARILEFPGYATFAQAFANTMPYSEAIGFVADTRDPARIDFPTYVTAHELAHQWWAHQLISADMQGATVLTETLAQYSALIVMEKTYGAHGIRRFLKEDLDGYLRRRGGEVIEELPLVRVENQGYIHYQKGGVVMYLLRDRIGEATVNAALRRLLARYAFKGAPYARSQDLIDALRAEAGPEHDQLITDLFEKITVYDLKTRTAAVKKRPDGRWDVTLTIEAKKMYADGQGKEAAVAIPAGEIADVGVFTAEPGKKGFSARDVVYFARHPIRSGAQTITLTVDREPKFAGVDPYNKQIDRNSDDNAIKVTT
jgi:ABC-2 type transport system permease protein